MLDLSPLPGLGSLFGLFPVVPPPANFHRASGAKICVDSYKNKLEASDSWE
jgi:hypothetical protein